VNGARTRGQTAALDTIEAMVRSHAPPHAILLVGPDGVGKTTLALDLAAGLLCEAEPGDRPCRACRACRMVENDGHPDLHRLGPSGPGGQVVIGGPDAKYRGIRDLITELALLPVEGRARVAIVEGADRMNEDAQSALLKTLEEPPAGVVIVLCADQEMRLLPTVRSRCARIRLGLVGSRDIEAIVGDHDLADPPMAARLGRLAAGRPGLALAYARAPEAVLIRAELSRVLLDLTAAGPAARLAAVRAAIPRAIALSTALSGDGRRAGDRTARRRGRVGLASREPTGGDNGAGDTGAAIDDAPSDDAPPDEAPGRPVPASERRRAAEILIGLWTDVARDLALAGAGGARSVRDPVMLEELAATATTLEPTAISRFLDRSARGAELLASNVSPELLLDSLALAWPRRRVVA
jgi:DNA polymerase-3 subunit delta'